MQHIMCTKGASFNVVPANVELISPPYTRHVWTGWAMSASRFSANLSPRQSSLTWHRPPFLFPCGEHVCLSARKSYLSLCGVFFLDILYVWYVHTDYRQLCLMQFIVQRPTKIFFFTETRDILSVRGKKNANFPASTRRFVLTMDEHFIGLHFTT